MLEFSVIRGVTVPFLSIPFGKGPWHLGSAWCRAQGAVHPEVPASVTPGIPPASETLETPSNSSSGDWAQKLKRLKCQGPQISVFSAYLLENFFQKTPGFEV